MQTEATLYELFLDLHPLILILIVGVPASLLMWLATWLGKRWTAVGDSGGFSDFAAAIIGLLGGAFIFVGAFAVVTSWDNQSQLASSVTSEFQALGAVVEDVQRTNPDPSVHQGIFADFEKYASIVRETELGVGGVNRANPEAELVLVELENQVLDLADEPSLAPLLAQNLYQHIGEVHDARISRLAIHLPNLPVAMNILMGLSAALVLIVVGLTPVGVQHRLKRIFSASAVLISVALIVAVLALQSPSSSASVVTTPATEFLTFIAEVQA
jgi:hypothetical protein